MIFQRSVSSVLELLLITQFQSYNLDTNFTATVLLRALIQNCYLEPNFRAVILNQPSKLLLGANLYLLLCYL